MELGGNEFDDVEAVPAINTETFDLIDDGSWPSLSCLRKIKLPKSLTTK